MATISAAAEKAYAPFKVGPLSLRNRFIRSGANEAAGTPDGLPSKYHVAVHREFAAGGLAMSTVSYTAVSPAARMFTNQLTFRADGAKHWHALTDAIHREGAAASVQLTHGGSLTFLPQPGGYALPSASNGFNAAGLLTGFYLTRAMTHCEIESVAHEFAQAAVAARDAGFDAVEIHMGHGYLLSQFLSPSSNRRRDEYGGSVEKRSRFPALVVERVRDAVGDKLAILCKLNVTDGFRGGVTAKDAAITAKILEQAGANMLVLSGGRTPENTPLIFGSRYPTHEFIEIEQRFLGRMAYRIMSLKNPKGPFKELYFRDHAMAVRSATQMPLALVGGIKSVANIAQVMDDGFDCIALARILIHDPNILLKLRSGEVTASGCISCNRCSVPMFHNLPTRCVLNKETLDPAMTQIPAAA